VPGEKLAEMRIDYGQGVFDVASLSPTWHDQLMRWLAEARAADVVEPNAMVVATTDLAGNPSSRTVLCKGLDSRGIVFYTNLASTKSRDLQAVSRASATFPWYAQYRQVHVQGSVAMVSREETCAYWASRPRGSQLGAWASTQSEPVADRETLDDALTAVTRRFAHIADVPLPPHWGGWRIEPDSVEFWQGRSDRMHDRLRFDLNAATGSWQVCRLAP
jgi:pyridoxamine 5'-phosphate oxidase